MRYGLIGSPLGHSHSPFLHERMGGEGYALLELPESALAGFFAAKEFDGVNVTIPYKRAVIPLLDEVDATARECGAVNTVINRGGRLVGYNTDLYGMRFALDAAGISLAGKRVVVLGSGGTSHTARALAAREGAASVRVVSRSGEYGYSDLSPLADAEILLNTTPVGMFPHMDAEPLSLSAFPALEGFFDAVYNPLRTRLALAADERGIKRADGLLMLAAQAKASRELFTGGEIPERSDRQAAAVITDAYRALFLSLTNIVLVGMPGSGKTTVGGELAALLGRDLVDTDELVERKAGRSIPDIFAEDGEAAFRDLEQKAVFNAGSMQGKVIATGGGAVLRLENRLSLAANGFVVYLRRDTDRLAREGRPLSLSGDLAAMLAARDPVYSAFADLITTNSGDPKTVATKIAEAFHEDPRHKRS